MGPRWNRASSRSGAELAVRKRKKDSGWRGRRRKKVVKGGPKSILLKVEKRGSSNVADAVFLGLTEYDAAGVRKGSVLLCQRSPRAGTE